MTSIERFVEKLNKSESTSTRHANPETGMLQPSPESEAKATSQETHIDFDRLEQAGMLSPNQANSKLAEEYRAIKRPLLKNAFGQGVVPIAQGNLIMVTSALPGEGKSFTAINLAMSMASEMDRTVLLVEADVAKPAACRYLGIPEPKKGLVDYLAEPGLELSSLLLKTNVPKLTLLPAGHQRRNSTELLASSNMRDLMDQLSRRYHDRVVLFDSPPLLLANEAVVLAGLMGQIVLVVEAGKTQQSVVKDAIALLDENKLVGVVLNKQITGPGAGYGNYGGYGYGYGGGQ